MRRLMQSLSVPGQMILIVLSFAVTGIFLTHVVMTFSLAAGRLLMYALGVDLLAVMVLITLLSTLIGVFVRLSTRPRIVRAARDNDTAILPECEQQPSVTAALLANEVLVMERTSPTKIVLRNSFSALLITLVGVMLLEVGIIPISSTLGPWFGDQIFPPLVPTPLPTLGALDWLTLGYPLALLLAGWFAALRTTLSQRRWQVRADDLGLTLRVGRRRTVLAWNQIQTIMRAQGIFDPNNVAGTYQIIDRDGSFVSLVIDQPPLNATMMARFTYAGGYERYQAGAQRLLATICARSITTLHYDTFGSKLRRRIQQRNPLITVNDNTIATSPVAEAEWQPAIIAAPTTFAKIEVRPRLSTRKIIGQGLILEGVILALMVVVAMITGYSPHLSLSGLTWQALVNPVPNAPLGETILLVGLIVLVFLSGIAIVVLLFSYGFFYAYSLQQKHESRLILTEEGIINSHRQNTFQPSSILWKDIYAWLVIPAKGRNHDDIYVIFYGNQQKAFWRNSPAKQLAGRRIYGDRHAAYQERLQAAHQIIAARTGLPLRTAKLEE